MVHWKTDKSLANRPRKKERTQVIKTGKKRRNISANLTEIKMNEREWHEQLCTNLLGGSDEAPPRWPRGYDSAFPMQWAPEHPLSGTEL